MARNSDGYSRAIGWLKIALPMVGLGILSTLFFVARDTRIEQGEMPEAFLAPDGGVETVSGPAYSGVTGDGASVSITAGTAWPKADKSGQLEAVEVRATFDLSDGGRTDVSARRGTIVPGEEALELREKVVVTTASGWTMRTEALDASLDWTRLTSPTEVRSEGPIGALDAGEMLITRDTEPGGTYLMEFDGGVHLVYRP